MTNRQYSRGQVQISWNGLDLTEGLADGVFLSITRNAESYTQRADGNGGSIQSFNPDRTGGIALTINVESQVHNQLTTLALADEATRNVVSAMYIRDLNNGHTKVLEACRIARYPDETRGTESATVTWNFIFGAIRDIPAGPGQNNTAI